MTPHWMVIEKLVVELGGVCASHDEDRSRTLRDAAQTLQEHSLRLRRGK